MAETPTFAPCPAPFNLADAVLAAGRACPDKVALAVLGPSRAERWRYDALERAVRGMAGALLADGLRPGDRVLMRIGNTVAFPIAYLGAIAAGIVPVPTAAGLTEGEVTRAAQAVSPRAVLAEGDLALPDLPGVPVLRDLIARADHAPADYAKQNPDALAYMVFTSGSSGQPKLVAHAHRAVWARRMMHRDWYGLGSEDRLCHAGAFNWTFTLGTGLLDPWSVGATALIPAPGLATEALPLMLKRHDATILAAAPGVFRRLLRAERFPDQPKLRHGLSAGEKLPETLRARWEARTGTTLHEALGMSECSTFISGAPARPAPDGTLGFPQDGRRVAVVTPEGAPVAAGETGILAVHRSDPGLMLGYWRGAETAPDLPLQGEWFLTGDLVAARDDGALIYHGRRDDLITAGGFRVAPAEIEAALAEAPGLAEGAALAVEKDAETTLIGYAYAGDVREDALRALAEARLAGYKRPRIYFPLSALPRSANGKLDRRALAVLTRKALR